MIQSLKAKLKSLIDAYQASKASGELEEETEYGARMESYRKWLRENILDLEKLHNYSDADFSEKFGELFDYIDGNPGLTRGMHFKSNEKRLEVRAQFENMVGFINGFFSVFYDRLFLLHLRYILFFLPPKCCRFFMSASITCSAESAHKI